MAMMHTDIAAAWAVSPASSISGTATAGGAAVNGQTATITIVDGSNAVKDSYTSVVTGGAWSVNVTAAQAQALACLLYTSDAADE